jgi:hypothetical protein
MTLVVLHHLAIVYGTGFIFYYVGPAYNDLLAYACWPFLLPSTRPTLWASCS